PHRRQRAGRSSRGKGRRSARSRRTPGGRDSCAPLVDPRLAREPQGRHRGLAGLRGHPGGLRGEGSGAGDEYPRFVTAAGKESSSRALDGESYFVRISANRFRPTSHTAGAWSATEQHFSPIGGLLTHAIEQYLVARGGDPLVIATIAFDILGTVALEDFDVRV